MLEFQWDKQIKILGEDCPQDHFNRASYAAFLTEYLKSQSMTSGKGEGKKRTHVVNLNAEWGIGKTYFLKRWHNTLKPEHPVVYIDSWKNDHSKDPLLTIISDIITQLREQAGKSEDNLFQKAPSQLVHILKAAAPALAKGLTKRYFDWEKYDEASESEESFDTSEVNEAIVKHILSEHDERINAIERLKEQVTLWVEAVKKDYPAFIFIDELDRCRPTYAIETLELIKHIFDIDGIVFVIATDTEQLQHSVKSIYGNGFNANAYLGRFFNSRFTLKSPDITDYFSNHENAFYLSSEYLESKYITVFPETKNEKEALKNISKVMNAFSLSTRTAIQINERILSVITFLPEKSVIDILFLTTLMCLKEVDDSLYNEIISGKFERYYEVRDGSRLMYNLSEFFDKKLSIKDSTIKASLKPMEISKYLYDSKNKMNLNNYYESGYYHFQFKQYLVEVFASHFDKHSKREGFNGNTSPLSQRKNNQLTNEQKVSQELLFKFRETQDKETLYGDGYVGLNWAKLIHIRNGFNGTSPQKYQNLVEMASLLENY